MTGTILSVMYKIKAFKLWYVNIKIWEMWESYENKTIRNTITFLESWDSKIWSTLFRLYKLINGNFHKNPFSI